MLYSVFGIRRAAFERLHIPRWISSAVLHVEDFLICITGGVGLSILYFATTRGVLRIMAIPLLGLGVLIWRLTGGRLVTVCTDAILNLIAAILRWLFRRILTPIGRVMKRICQRIGRAIARQREKRYVRHLERMARRETLRYSKALETACLSGHLPDGKCRRGQTVRSVKHKSTKRIRKESFK